MKKYFLALLVSVSLMSMQAASAATLTLTNISGGSVITSSGGSVSGHATGVAFLGIPVSQWKLDLSDNSEVAFSLSGGLPFSTSLFDNSVFAPPSVFDFLGGDGSVTLTAGTYYLAIFSGFGRGGIGYDLSASLVTDSNNNVPLPASVWLFGSALMGLFGASRRKSKAGFAA